ncbi:uncharacterized protein BHQ10_000339 [Talaromyces amestolkiae]|uniref:Uncharacterized protein n=1 Tax=Talaromyces amestolkiae TaxID=1196081 RepID=A0A364KLB1_TALAM|nr:uncharacterized protein BHQ10_000339 [Talaromyces amestolkiae]RAO64327.1 hypothetical protein BHQ10_000339 [Talaromyces amestolkiae]
MPPIRTFKSAPINSHSAANTPTPTSETQEQKQQHDNDVGSGETIGNEGAPAWTPATPTAAASIGDTRYPAARPGAPAMPAPTSSTSVNTYTPTRTYPTSTLNSADQTSSPPAPQPGSRPVPPTSSSSSSLSPSPNRATATGAVPPPPKVGEKVQPASYYTPSPLQQQHQQIIPNSTSTPYLSTYQPPSSYTSTYVAGSASGLPLSQPEQSNSTSASSIFDGALGEGTTGQDILNTARSWMASAGNKLAEAEEEVWKMVNKKS